MRDFRKYKVWESSHNLALKIYECTSSFPSQEVYGITSQIRRAATSIPTNIAEGCGRESDTEFKRFLVIASGSVSEVNYLLILSKDLGYIPNEEYVSLEDEVIQIHKSIYALINKLN